MPSARKRGEAHELPIYAETIFVDRSLGATIVPDGLRSAGLTVVTMREHYGEAAGAQVADVDWIAEAAQAGWVMFHKDNRIRRNAAELQAVEDNAGRMFCITNASITGQQSLDRLLASLPAISRAARKPGPYVYGVDEKSINRLYP